MAASEIRYGISALMTDYYKQAEIDELMVDKSTGKIYYKREDGRVVSTSENIEHNRLCNSIAMSFHSNEIESNPSDYVLYHIFDTSEKINMLSNDVIDLGNDKEFVISKDVNGFFIRLHGTEEINVSVAVVDALSSPSVLKPSVAKFSFYLIKDGGVTSLETMDVPFNVLVFIPLENDTTKDMKIVPKSIQYENFSSSYEALSDEKKGQLKVLNLGNETFKVDVMDLITFAASIGSTTIATEDRTLLLHSIISMEEVSVYEDFIKSMDEYSSEEVLFRLRDETPGE